MLERIRWSNVARLVFVLAGLALVVGGVPRLGGRTERMPELGLPDEVLRPGPAGESPTAAQHPPPIRRIVQRPRRERSRRERLRPPAKPRRRGARPARRVPPVTAVPAPPAPPPVSPPAAGEFGP